MRHPARRLTPVHISGHAIIAAGWSSLSATLVGERFAGVVPTFDKVLAQIRWLARFCRVNAQRPSVSLHGQQGQGEASIGFKLFGMEPTLPLGCFLSVAFLHAAERWDDVHTAKPFGAVLGA